jgi:plasmid stability protein
MSRVAFKRERFLIERHGRPMVALVPLEDLERLEHEPAAPKGLMAAVGAWADYEELDQVVESIPDELLHRLRLMAAEQRTSMAALVREALEEEARSYRPRPRSWGIGASGHTDTASKAGDMRPEPRSWR